MKLHNVISFGMIFVCFGYGAVKVGLNLFFSIFGIDVQEWEDELERAIKKVVVDKDR